MYVSMTTNETLSPPYPKYGQLSMTLDRRQLATVNLYGYAVTSSSSKDAIHYIQPGTSYIAQEDDHVGNELEFSRDFLVSTENVLHHPLSPFSPVFLHCVSIILYCMKMFET